MDHPEVKPWIKIKGHDLVLPHIHAAGLAFLLLLINAIIILPTIPVSISQIFNPKITNCVIILIGETFQIRQPIVCHVKPSECLSLG